MKYIYLINSEGTNKYKIGIAKNPNERVKQLQTGNSEKLEIVEIYKSKYASKIEKNFHRRYNYTSLLGEWFIFNEKEETKFIEMCKLYENGFRIIEEKKI